MANKSKEELTQELHQKNVEKFLKEYEEAYEKYITPINVKHELRLIPTIQHNQVGGMNPAYGLEKYKREEASPQDPVSNEDTANNEKPLETETN